MSSHSAPQTPTVLPARRKRRRFKSEWLYPTALIAALLVLWQVSDTPEYLWPSMNDTADLLVHSDALRISALETTKLILIGFAIAVTVGLGLATLVTSSAFFERGFFPILVVTQFVPLVALAPLFIVWWGFDMTPKLVIIVLFGYFPVAITTIGGLRAVEVEKEYLTRSMGASRVDQFRRLRFPNALPSIFAGLKICYSSCVIGAVIAEFIVGSAGLGYRILQAQGVGDSTTLVAGVVYLAVIGAVGFILLALAERLLIPWHASQRINVLRTLG